VIDSDVATHHVTLS